MVENKAICCPQIISNAGCPLFFNNDFPWLFHVQKLKIHDVSAQHVFPNKLHMTAYIRISSDSCSCSSYYWQEDQITRVFTRIYKYLTTVCPTQLHSLFLSRISQCRCKNSTTLSSFSRTFRDLCCFPWLSKPGKWSSKIPWLSITFQDQWAPC